MRQLIYELLQYQISENASDLHIYSGRKPYIRHSNGDLIVIEKYEPISFKQINEIISLFAKHNHHLNFEKKGVCEVSEIIEGYRFRINFYKEFSGISAVFRLLKFENLDREALGLPVVLNQIAEFETGLILVAGSNGSGKTTTLTSIVEKINLTKRKNIVTLEDPIETLFKDKKSVITQIEVGTHVPDFADAGKYLFRQDVNVVVIGEMRDLDSFRTAITMATTGHLVITTIHAEDVENVITRLISSFPSIEQNMVRLSLAYTLKAIVTQKLIPNIDHTSRFLATEVLIKQPSLPHLILENRLSNIIHYMETGTSSGMMTFEQSYDHLYKKGLISNAQRLVLRRQEEN